MTKQTPVKLEQHMVSQISSKISKNTVPIKLRLIQVSRFPVHTCHHNVWKLRFYFFVKFIKSDVTSISEGYIFSRLRHVYTKIPFFYQCFNLLLNLSCLTFDSPKYIYKRLHQSVQFAWFVLILDLGSFRFWL